MSAPLATTPTELARTRRPPPPNPPSPLKGAAGEDPATRVGWGRLSMSMSRAALALVALAVVACATHEPRPAFRRGVLIDDRGISVPLPPPSLIDAPKVDVEVEGSLPGADALTLGTVIHLDDIEGDARVTADIDVTTAAFAIDDVTIDLTANCLELWLEAPDGRESERTLVHAEIDGDDGVVTVPGCE